MKQKKQSPEWNVAAAHWFTSTFLPFLLVLILGFIQVLVTHPSEPFLVSEPFFVGVLLGVSDSILLRILSNLIGIIGLFLGIIYSANYIKKSYIISNSIQVVNLSTIYYVISGIICKFYWFSMFSIGSFSINEIFSLIDFFSINIIFFLIGIVVFYTASKKYVMSDDSK